MYLFQINIWIEVQIRLNIYPIILQPSVTPNTEVNPEHSGFIFPLQSQVKVSLKETIRIFLYQNQNTFKCFPLWVSLMSSFNVASVVPWSWCISLQEWTVTFLCSSWLFLLSLWWTIIQSFSLRICIWTWKLSIKKDLY